jgi:tetratricopeptide (TPR) repeat protein
MRRPGAADAAPGSSGTAPLCNAHPPEASGSYRMAAVISEENMGAGPEKARQLLLEGRVAECIATLKELHQRAGPDPFLLQKIAEIAIKCGQHELAADCHARSVRLQPQNPAFLYNLATSKTALGDLQEAERLFTEVIRLSPDDHGAWLNRSALRKQTPDLNHVAQLKFVKSRLPDDHPGQIPVCYALAKELEDLEMSGESFAFLQEGSARRRNLLQYRVEDDEQAMALIAESFDYELLRSATTGPRAGRPVFILGLPRSGTTLLDRIVSSHDQVASLGEHNLLAISLMLEAGDGASAGKSELIRASTSLDFASLGRRYVTGIEGFGHSAPRLIDKTPLNFLYVGLIRLALPDARIIHLRRHPMDSCYAMYKTLFRAGYPFSYSLQDVGRYYIAYHKLMDHWRAAIPDAFLDVDYEKLVANPEPEVRRIFEYLDLPWQGGCLDFHRHSGVAATASAAQVRQPIYTSSVGLWRRYARQLAPFENKLREHGIDTR